MFDAPRLATGAPDPHALVETKKSTTSSPLGEDEFFNPWRRARSAKAQAIIREAVRLIENYEQQNGLRLRRRKLAAQRLFERAIEALVCNLLLHNFRGKSGAIAVPFAKEALVTKSRDRPAWINQSLPGIVRAMTSAEVGLAELSLGKFDIREGERRRTTIAIGPRLRSLIEVLQAQPEHVGIDQQRETITLRQRDYESRGPNCEVLYQDTKTTRAFRREMAQLNAHLEKADLSFDQSIAKAAGIPEIDTNDRFMRRIFSRGRFDSGGRLYGGFWQPLSKAQRFAGLQIDRQRIVELDFGQAALRIVYGLSGRDPPEGDLYAIPGLEGSREGIKKVISTLLFDLKPRNSLPRDTRKLFSPRISFSDVLTAILEKHPVLRSYLGTGVGHRTQFIESQILIRALRNLRRQGVTALPIHDAILLPGRHAQLGRAVMVSAFESIAKTKAVVECKRGCGSAEVIRLGGSPAAT